MASATEIMKDATVDLLYTVTSGGAAQPLDGATITWRLIAPGVDLSADLDSVDAAVEKAGVITDAVNGEFTVPLVPADTADCEPAPYYHAFVRIVRAGETLPIRSHLVEVVT